MKRFRPRLTYSGVASTLALVLALTTGAAYAANEWTGANIQNGTLTGADIKSGSVAGIDLKNGTVASIDIKDESLTGADIADDSIQSQDIGTLHGDNVIGDGTLSHHDLGDNSVRSEEVLDFGLSNEDIGVLFALVNSDGTLAASSGGVTSGRLSVGQFEVDFGRDVSACAPVATQGVSGSLVPLGGTMGVADRILDVNAIYVNVRDKDAAYVDRSFVLIVVC